MGTARTQSKDKYNEREYSRYTLRVRKDSLLYEELLRFTSRKGVSLNGLITEMLEVYFDVRETPVEYTRRKNMLSQPQTEYEAGE
jgi:hypothetical protein